MRRIGWGNRWTRTILTGRDVLGEGSSEVELLERGESLETPTSGGQRLGGKPEPKPPPTPPTQPPL